MVITIKQEAAALWQSMMECPEHCQATEFVEPIPGVNNFEEVLRQLVICVWWW